jgi:hypothetical protein
MQDSACEIRSIRILRTRVHRGKRKGRSPEHETRPDTSYPARTDSGPGYLADPLIGHAGDAGGVRNVPRSRRVLPVEHWYQFRKKKTMARTSSLGTTVKPLTLLARAKKAA